jgi:Fe-S-cluster-containing dehydrogenase component
LQFLRENLFLQILINVLAAKFVSTYVHLKMALTCRLCEDAPCVAACPRDALEQSEEAGVVLIDEDKCNGCGWCIEACDFGAVTLHPETRVVMMCDLCAHRSDKNPQCVEWCPEEALYLTTKELLAQKARIASVKKLFVEAMKTVPP